MFFRKPIWFIVMVVVGCVSCGNDDGGGTSQGVDTTTITDIATVDGEQPADTGDTTTPPDIGEVDDTDATTDVGSPDDAIIVADGTDGTGADADTTADTDDSETTDSTGDPDSTDNDTTADIVDADVTPTDTTVDDTAADATPTDTTEPEDQGPWIPPVFACKKDGDCVLQFPDLPPCEVAACNLVTGDCEVLVLDDNTPCADSDPCSTGDRCLDGSCVPIAQNCDDLNDCTDDVCFPGIACLNHYNVQPCDDSDVCTTDDRCIQGECSGDLVFCNDKDNCTADYCVDGECTYLPLPTAACCFTKVAGWTFDDATLGGFTATNPSPKVGWKTVEDQYFKSPVGSLYFGDTKTLTYDDAGAPVSGTALSPLFLLPTAGVVAVTMDAWLDIEQTVVKDRLWIYVVFTNGEKEEVWFKSSKTEINMWTEINIDLTAYLGQVIRLEFQFDSVDGSQNSGKGVFIDDIRVIASCPEEPCAQNFDCDDGVLCTTDVCEFEACVHTFVDNCCVSNADCNDDNVCTTDQCIGNLCQHPLNTKPCNDKDPCTWKDQCNQGQCVGVPFTCDDNDPCTVDACSSGNCTFEPSGALECCHKEVVQFGFDSGNLGEWSVNSTPGSPGWHVSSYRAATFPFSARFGSSGAYSESGKAASGTLESPLFPLSPLPALEIRFWTYLDVEPGADVDTLKLVGTSPAGKSIILWEKPANFPLQQWVWVQAPAEFFATAGGIELQFVFETIDNANNTGEGVYIDDVRLHVPCTNLVCTGPGDSQCDDGLPETVDGCFGGQCQSDALLWYCATATDCDDQKTCTDQFCVANTCQFVVTPGCCDDDEQCLDTDPCTEDFCSATHVCTQTPTTGACDDSDPCTVSDQCKNGTCVGTAQNCDDQNVCTAESCVAGDCIYTLIDLSDQCCNFALLEENFSGDLTTEGWTFINSNPKAGWQKSGVRFVSAPAALYFGDPVTLSYNAGAAKGTAESPTFTLPNSTTARLEFALWLDVEQSLDYDQLSVAVVPQSTKVPVVVWTKPQKPNTQQFQPISIPLDTFVGQSVKIRFVFDTIDASTNHREGVAIDDLRIWIGCPPSSCTVNTDCNDNNGCTTDVCSDGTCIHETLPSCCVQNTDCNDLNPCTVDTCATGTCQHTPQPNCCQSAADCDDKLVCTTDQCDQTKGCTHTANTLTCADMNPCTEGDVCAAGKCIGTALSCDDGDLLCTVDVCKNGQCVHIPTGQTNCCVTDTDCDDSDPCTDTTCTPAGVCVATQICCSTPTDCDDENACTTDLCIAQSCVSGQAPQAACCDETVWLSQFDTGAGGYQMVNNSSKVGWFVTTTGPSKSPPGALGFSDPAGSSMAGATTTGSASTPWIPLPNRSGLTLGFWVYLDTELGGKYDLATLYVEEGNQLTAVWTKSSIKAGSQWLPQSVDIGAYGGKTVRLHWFFHMIDGEHNSGKGFFVDDLMISAPCP